MNEPTVTMTLTRYKELEQNEKAIQEMVNDKDQYFILQFGYIGSYDRLAVPVSQKELYERYEYILRQVEEESEVRRIKILELERESKNKKCIF